MHSTQPHGPSPPDLAREHARAFSDPQYVAHPQTRIDIDRERARRSFLAFIKMAWHVLEPATELKVGWAIEAICAHLEAVTRGDITRLLMNVPPGTMKSLTTSVLWQAWEWGPMGMAFIKAVTASYETGLSIRDARKLRMLVESDWYQARWPIKLADDQNQKTRFENDKTGFRAIRPITSLTGERGHRLIIDDPHSIKLAESDVQRIETVREFREAAPTRLIDPMTSAIIVIMQRVHQKDVAGEIIDSIGGYEHLCLPMEYDPKSHCRTSIGFSDPRTEENELLFPERFPREVVERDKKVMGAYATAAQFQQLPSPRSGGLFKRHNFGTIPALPAGCVFVRKWDLAGTEGKKSDATAGLLMAKTPDERTIVVDVVTVRAEPSDVERIVKATAEQDRTRYGRTVVQHFNIDPGQAGKSQRNAYAKLLKGFILKFEKEKGTKAYRALAVAAQVEVGNVFLLDDGSGSAAWIGPFLDELAMFPAGAHDDQVDAFTGAYNFMNDPGAATHFMDWLVQEVQRMQAEARGETAERIADMERTPMRPPPGVTNATGLKGDAYGIDGEGVMWVRPDDAKILKRAGFVDVVIETEEETPEAAPASTPEPTPPLAPAQATAPPAASAPPAPPPPAGPDAYFRR